MRQSLYTRYFKSYKKFDGFNFDCLAENRQKHQNFPSSKFSTIRCLPNTSTKYYAYAGLIYNSTFSVSKTSYIPMYIANYFNFCFLEYRIAGFISV